MKYADLSVKERCRLYDVAAMAFLAGYCTDRENPASPAEMLALIGRIHAEFDKWWGDIDKPTVIETTP